MIQFLPINQAQAHKQTLKSIYHDSFPPDERRDWNELMKLSRHLHFNFYSIINHNNPVGLLTLWKWSELTFIEHFAIEKTCQGKGIGSEVLNQLKQETTAKIILETEEPTSVDAIRRVNFYSRSGFKICEEEYYQPPYSLEKKSVKMLLMSYPDKVTHNEFIIIRSMLYKEVYQINGYFCVP